MRQGDADGNDADANNAYHGADTTFRFYKEVYGRDSVDGQGLELVSSVHYGNRYENAFWDGGQMVYGDGGGGLFIAGGLTAAIDVIGHELTHGVTQYTANLEYSKQSGALNESMSDVFGSLVKQFSLGQTADQADWLIGEGILEPSLGKALRSMKAPGTAFDGDNQPATMADYRDLPDDNDPRNDNGGVHVNSGIPNHAFYLAATAIGGNAWEKAGKIWYTALTDKLVRTSDFAAAARATVEVAGGGAEQEAVHSAWQQVGVLS
jgi:Zn-dependent metalloprotease